SCPLVVEEPGLSHHEGTRSGHEDPASCAGQRLSLRPRAGGHMNLRDVDDRTNEISSEIIGSAIEVQRALGPGLLEAPYRAALAEELRQRGHEALEEHPVPVLYKGRSIDVAYRIDILVERRVVVEVKAIAQYHPRHEAQLLNYMRLSK